MRTNNNDLPCNHGCGFIKQVKAMSVIFKNIKDRKLELDKAIESHSMMIKGYVSGFLEAYISSLNLPKRTWRDIEGNDRPYVTILQGDHDDNAFEGEIKEVSPFALKLDYQYKARFFIDTVIDDSPRGGSYVRQKVSIFKIDGLFFVSIIYDGYEENDRYQITGNAITAYDAVCEKLKDNVLMSIKDDNLNISTRDERL